MITREDVKDLQPGDVVEITSDNWPTGSSVRGPLRLDRDGWLICADTVVRLDDGDAVARSADHLVLIERGPRLYVNHGRGNPLPGDVVRDADDETDASTWHFLPRHLGVSEPWIAPTSKPGELLQVSRDFLPDRLRLLVDGETGQVVP